MKRFWILNVVLAAGSCPVWGQKVEVQKPDQAQIVHIQTALNHLTILEFKEQVLTVAVGSPVFKVEWRENKVFIEPTDENLATNLFVWTASSRFNYELDPAGAVPQMVFAIDQPPSQPATTEPTKRVDPPAMSPADVLIGTKPIRMYGAVSDKKRVSVFLRDVYEHEGQIFIGYTIRNDTTKAYTPGVPRVVIVNSPRYRDSLYVLAHSQLSPREAARLRASGETSITVTQAEIGSTRTEPGQETSGILAIKLPPTHETPCVLRLTFLPTAAEPVTATLVL